MDDIEALDVVATYVGADKQEKFWLFMANEKPSQIKSCQGRWFSLVENGRYNLERKDKCKATSIMRLSKELNNFYVLKKHDMNDEFYLVSDRLKLVLEREADSVFTDV